MVKKSKGSSASTAIVKAVTTAMQGKGYRYKRRNQFRSLTRELFGGFPQSKTVKLRYNDQVLISPTAAMVAQFHAFRANSIYDPDATGVGHQPLGRDIWAGLYNRYMVIGAKISVKMVPTGTSNYHATCGVLVDDDATVDDQNVTTLIERGKSRYKSFLNSYTSGSKSVTTLKQTFSAKKWFGFKDAKDNDYGYGAPVGQNPSDQAYFIVWVGSHLADIDAVSAIVTIDYIVTFTEPRDVPAS